jgi:plastocyanin
MAQTKEIICMRIRIPLFLSTLALSVFAVACGSSSDSPVAPSPGGSGGGSPMSISIVSGASGLTTTAYSPNPDTIAVGDTIVWRNTDTTAHTATADDRSWDSGGIAPGATFSRTFGAAGTYTYHCTIHPGMVGTVTVR